MHFQIGTKYRFRSIAALFTTCDTVTDIKIRPNGIPPLPLFFIRQYVHSVYKKKKTKIKKIKCSLSITEIPNNPCHG